MPTLRERKEDIPLLVNHFLKKYKNEMPKIITTVSSLVMEALMRYDWQGNVRQLENVIYRAMVATRSETIEIENLSTEIQKHTAHGSIIKDHSLDQPTPSGGTTVFDTPGSQTLETTSATLQEMEKHALVEALKIAGGNVKQVAESLGISRTTCYRKIEKYQIKQIKKYQIE
jgi:DNA-binding NtrC family response regulator